MFFTWLNLASNFDLTWLRNRCPQVKLFLTARCAVDMDSIGIGTTGVTSVVCPLLTSATFRAVLQISVRRHRLRPAGCVRACRCGREGSRHPTPPLPTDPRCPALFTFQRPFFGALLATRQATSWRARQAAGQRC